MQVLPSDLPEPIADDEDLARFLVSSRQYNTSGVKHTAFLPSSIHDETSVFRHGSNPLERLWSLAENVDLKGRTLHGAAIVTAINVRESSLDVIADEPPPRHAAIRNWPDNNDVDLRKAQHKEIAMEIAAKARIILRSP